MQKPFITAVSLLTAGMMLLGNALAQQTPAANPQQPPAAKAQAASPAGAQKAPAAKTGPATKPRTQSVLTLKTQKDKLSYALGMNLGSNLHKETVEVDPAIVLRGLKDGLASGKTLLTEDEARTTLTQLQTEVRSKQQEKMKVAGEMNKKEGVEFLAANKTKEGVVILPSGLQYKILTAGTGPKPTAGVTSGKWSHQGLDGSSPTDAGRIEMATFCPSGAGLRRSRRWRGHRTRRDSYF